MNSPFCVMSNVDYSKSFSPNHIKQTKFFREIHLVQCSCDAILQVMPSDSSRDDWFFSDTVQIACIGFGP